MDKSEIKKLLKEQVEPMDNAVRKKLEYLQSDDVFTENGVTEMQGDISLMNAFNENMPSANIPSYSQPSVKEFYQTAQNTPEPKRVSQAPIPQSIDEHKQNIAARIAALRGMSMAGDYLRKK
ncbi:MAG: hypothetical protein IJ532_06555 [Alphaproteobacteria bacterium]|nr:hypothetical protein [Alphaproteobacteria bacterium]